MDGEKGHTELVNSSLKLIAGEIGPMYPILLLLVSLLISSSTNGIATPHHAKRYYYILESGIKMKSSTLAFC
jgi:hypothetical protein